MKYKFVKKIVHIKKPADCVECHFVTVSYLPVERTNFLITGRKLAEPELVAIWFNLLVFQRTGKDTLTNTEVLVQVYLLHGDKQRTQKTTNMESKDSRVRKCAQPSSWRGLAWSIASWPVDPWSWGGGNHFITHLPSFNETHGVELLGNPSHCCTHHSTGVFPLLSSQISTV